MKTKNNRPLFITFEGGEGSGKSTLIQKLEQNLLAKGLDVVITREPGGTKLSDHIRHWLLNREFGIAIGAKAELLLFLAARAQHIEELILPSLSSKKIVLCDRFNDSTIVYQGIARGLGKELARELCNLVCGALRPDLTLFLDVDPSVGLARARQVMKADAAPGQVDRIEGEKLDFHSMVRKGFLGLAAQDPTRIRTIDAMQPLEAVYNMALKEVEQLLS